MRIKLDENLPIQLVPILDSLGHQVHTVNLEGLSGSPDHEIWEVAQREKRFFVTQDMDFSDVRKFAPGTHAGLLLVRLHPASRINLIQRIEEMFRVEDVEAWACCFVLASDRKVRVRR
jgi:predicted nuclease of predicted toxin-antitoxin system